MKDKKICKEAAQCLDDCLILIYPEEFTTSDFSAATQRMSDGGGVINRVAGCADKLRGVTE